MPSHSDRVRRHYKNAKPEAEPPLTAPRERLERPLSELDRYAGWLTRDHVSVAVRADVQALSAALASGSDTYLPLLTLDKDLGRLPGGDLRKMLRKALGEIRAVLEPAGVGVHGGQVS